MLTLVFVKSLYLNIEYAVRVYLKVKVAVCFAVLEEVLLVFVLNLCKLVKNGLIVSEKAELFKLAAVLQEIIADFVSEKLCQTRI